MRRGGHVGERGAVVPDSVVSGPCKRRGAGQWLAGAGSWWRTTGPHWPHTGSLVFYPSFPPAFCTNPELGVGTATGRPLKAREALRARGNCNHMLDCFSDPLSVPSKQVGDVTQGPREETERQGHPPRNHRPRPTCLNETHRQSRPSRFGFPSTIAQITRQPPRFRSTAYHSYLCRTRPSRLSCCRRHSVPRFPGFVPRPGLNTNSNNNNLP